MERKTGGNWEQKSRERGGWGLQMEREREHEGASRERPRRGGGGTPWEPLPNTTQARIDTFFEMHPNRFGYISDCFVSTIKYGKTLSTCPKHTIAAPDARPRTHFCGTPFAVPPPFRLFRHKLLRACLKASCTCTHRKRRVPLTLRKRRSPKGKNTVRVGEIL